jgi:hypothetical protein
VSSSIPRRESGSDEYIHFLQTPPPPPEWECSYYILYMQKKLNRKIEGWKQKYKFAWLSTKVKSTQKCVHVFSEKFLVLLLIKITCVFYVRFQNCEFVGGIKI